MAQDNSGIQYILESEKAVPNSKASPSGFHMMYGTFLVPFLLTHPGATLLEFGSGCSQSETEVVSIALWSKMFPTADLWEGNLDPGCQNPNSGLRGVRQLTTSGHQSEEGAVREWLKSIQTDLHVVIHHGHQKMSCFSILWQALKPGGMYFMQVSDDDAGISTTLQQWIDELLTHPRTNPMPSGVESIYCQTHACMIRKQVCHHEVDSSGNFVAHNIRSFASTAQGMPRVTDKTTHHRYQVMYATFLLPFMQARPQSKMLEIGLGCMMDTGPGASVELWKRLFPMVELWEAEYYANCVEKARKAGQLVEGVGIVTGDQGDKATLQEWVNRTGGNFDVIVDDGSHHNKHIKATFDELWPSLRPGGLYFMEDLQVGRDPPFADGQAPSTSEIMQAWV